MSGLILNNFGRKSLSGGGTNEGQSSKVVAEVKHVKEAPDKGDRRLEVKLSDRDARNSKMLIDAPVQIARKVTPGKTYEFELTDNPFRGGGASCFQTMREVKRTDARPVEVSGRGGAGAGGGGKMGDRFGRGYSGSHMDFY